MTERKQALHILTTLLREKTPLNHLMKTYECSPFTKELCFGVCRYYFRLGAILDLLLEKRPKAKDLDVWVCLLLGIYQLRFMNQPEYAAVQETVGLIDARKKPWAKSLVNAVLRNYCRRQNTLPQPLESDKAYLENHPAWFIKRLQQDWPHQWQSILNANDQHPPMSLRVNTLQYSANDYLSQLDQEKIAAHAHQFSSQGITLETPCAVDNLPEFHTGAVSVQDQAAQLAVTLLDLKPGLRLLDACAAPGGKTCHILETEPKLASVTALEIDAQRITRIQENLTRLQLNACLIAGDGVTPHTWWDKIPFERILLDAPCSATGVIRRHPDIKLLRTEAEIQSAAAQQSQLLNALWPLLAKGGRLVYATCSIMAEENEHQIQRFIEEHADCQIPTLPLPWGHFTGHGWQIFPGEDNMDGFFYSVLVKHE